MAADTKEPGPRLKFPTAFTILLHSAQAAEGLSAIAFINMMYWLEVALSFFVPSSSGLAVLTMPIMAPLADFSGVGHWSYSL